MRCARCCASRRASRCCCRRGARTSGHGATGRSVRPLFSDAKPAVTHAAHSLLSPAAGQLTLFASARVCAPILGLHVSPPVRTSAAAVVRTLGDAEELIDRLGRLFLLKPSSVRVTPDGVQESAQSGIVSSSDCKGGVRKEGDGFDSELVARSCGGRLPSLTRCVGEALCCALNPLQWGKCCESAHASPAARRSMMLRLPSSRSPRTSPDQTEAAWHDWGKLRPHPYVVYRVQVRGEPVVRRRDVKCEPLTV